MPYTLSILKTYLWFVDEKVDEEETAKGDHVQERYIDELKPMAVWDFITSMVSKMRFKTESKKTDLSQVYSDVLVASRKVDCSVEELVSKSLELTYCYANLMDLLIGLDENGDNGISQIKNRLYQAKNQLKKRNLASEHITNVFIFWSF
ncbi:DNA relaxase NicK (NicK) [Fructobacillus fructosus]|uniref:DNA relaxase NicK (NicK) n=1 Tax=Fructobacillus fructosus TaxID=1631 RepID=A0ABM9MR56_9LACO|nr:DNA relaxase NicK (NicK) [Fructobacillus fructosus]